jgi:hypothetical protein
MSFQVDVGSFGSVNVAAGSQVIAGMGGDSGGPFVVPEYARGRLFKLVPQIDPSSSAGASIIFFNEAFSYDGTNVHAFVTIQNNAKKINPTGDPIAQVNILWMATPDV